MSKIAWIGDIDVRHLQSIVETTKGMKQFFETLLFAITHGETRSSIDVLQAIGLAPSNAWRFVEKADAFHNDKAFLLWAQRKVLLLVPEWQALDWPTLCKLLRRQP